MSGYDFQGVDRCLSLVKDECGSGYVDVLQAFWRAVKALKGSTLSYDEATAVLLASILDGSNCCRLLTLAGMTAHTENVIEMLKAVPMLQAVPMLKAVPMLQAVIDTQDRFKWIPRDVKRLGDLGVDGFQKCLERCIGEGLPMCVASTPTPKNRVELRDVLYHRVDRQSCHGSVSFLDCFYDHLLHLTPSSDNAYIDRKFTKHRDILVDMVLSTTRVISNVQ